MEAHKSVIRLNGTIALYVVVLIGILIIAVYRYLIVANNTSEVLIPERNEERKYLVISLNFKKK